MIPLAAGVIFTTLVRLAVTLDARAPQVVADETAYLAMARFSAGGPAWNLADAAPYMPLYSLLIAPAELFGFGPAATFRWAVVMNVMLAGVTSFVVVEALASHLAGMGRPWDRGGHGTGRVNACPGTGLRPRFGPTTWCC